MANFNFDELNDSKWRCVELSSLSENIVTNPNGWGPTNGSKLPEFSDVPYAHFDKKERINRIAELSGTQYNKGFQRRSGENAEFQYKHDNAEDSSFQLVDNAKIQQSGRSNPVARGRNVRQNWQQQNRGREPYQNSALRFGQGKNGRDNKNKKGQGNRGMRRFNDRKERVASLTVGVDWQLEDEFDLTQLLKLQANPPKDCEDLVWCGQLDTYDETFEKTTTRTAVPLKREDNKVHYSVTTMDDPVIEKYAVEGISEVFATDAVLAAIMAAPRSIYSWDLVIQKTDGVIYLDKRDGSVLDLLTVSETAHDPPQAGEGMEEINTPDKLSIEATMINQNFTQQILLPASEQTRKTFEPHPFFTPDDEDTENMLPASVAYRYRKFPMGKFSICCRTELHASYTRRGTENLLNCFALNEWDSKYSGGINWRQKIDQQRGAVLATELKNNSCKVARWTAQSILSGADQMKVGYVSRTRVGEVYDHQILATQFFKPKDLATQTNLSITNMWGVIKMLCEVLLSKADGKYVLLKDPNKSTMRLYSVPLSTFEGAEEDEVEAMLEDEN